MLRKFGTEGVALCDDLEVVDARSAALSLMSDALAHLDSDSNIPASIGAHLQSAIDALWISVSRGQHSNRLQ